MKITAFYGSCIWFSYRELSHARELTERRSKATVVVAVASN
ncbi:hypothetical protein [Sporomusa ovata]|uniref:Uncharacterized protein n=1 Tax=Sporomusa ovata TaxID=2378 RepID=A0A0U1L685_9FIRM|nr:hypothetical protein [Sporomusa ovata]CQR75197.1 hypothetical protein SpAn4DRAFT_4561 [Sporomusa ovata]